MTNSYILIFCHWCTVEKGLLGSYLIDVIAVIDYCFF